MGAFRTNLVAISWQAGQYAVASQIIAQIDSGALKRDGLLHDVAEDVGYVDEAAVLQKSDFAKYLLPETSPLHNDALQWFTSLPREIMFVLVHRAEWESGISD